jgi:precorrin-6A/cobalt-precorrin-6A reductase
MTTSTAAMDPGLRRDDRAGRGLRLLILGGTTEARELAARLAGDARFDATLSLAGRTADPALQPLPTRVGGFGGVDGLVAWLRVEAVDVLIDATHPFALRISENARTASTIAGVPLLHLERSGWDPTPGDRWTIVPDQTAAALALGEHPRRVFLTTGRLGVAAFRAAPQHHYLLRSIDPPDAADLPPECEVILARGPFPVEDEIALMRRYGIDMVVSKNSGSVATYAKIEAARHLGLTVIMIGREAPAGEGIASVEAVMARLEALFRRR